MLSDLAATADVRGHRVHVTWTWSGLGTRPAFRLVRRRRAYPAGPEDGFAVVDSGGLFRAPAEPWARASQLRYLAAGSPAEGGLLAATVTLHYAAGGAVDPARVEVAHHDEGTGASVIHAVDAVTAVELTLPDPGPWGSVERLAITHAPGGGAGMPAGVLTVSRGHADGTTPSRLEWQPAVGAPVQVAFDAAELVRTVADVAVASDRELAATWPRIRRRDATDLATALAADDPPPGAVEELGRLALHERFSEDSGDWTRRFDVDDLAAVPEQTAYYALFAADGGGWRAERGWTARATPTARYGLEDRLYELLPSVHRYYDEPTPADRGAGQLRRFLQLFGVTLDHLRSGAEGLRSRHDLAEAREDLLPALGAWIAWPVDRTAPLPAQRSEIGMAPAVYETVGTVPNVVALATRVTGWPCQVKEFVHNLFLTNAPESVPVRELWEIAHDGAAFGPPVRLASTGEFDGRPSAVPGPAASTWLFWHSSRSGRWELWTRALAGDGSAEPAPLDPPEGDAPPPAHADLSPAAIRFPDAGDEVWLFWESDRDGAWDIWGRVHDGAGWSAPLRLTDHPAADRRPGVALGPAGTLWLFWESRRRGRAEIWSRTYDGTAWTPAVRVTEGFGEDHEPAAALDAGGVLRLVWRRDEAGRSRLYTQALEGGAWGPAAPLDDGPWRDEAPALARRGGELWLLWHSDRTGRWELWARVHDGAGWGAPLQVTMRADADKEPALLVDGASLRIFWRSERPAPEHRSLTVDTGDVPLLEHRGLFGDRLHYTYDTAREEHDWYARDVAGVYVTPPPGTPDAVVGEVLERARNYLEPFCPATVRLVLIPARAPESADFFTDGFDAGDPVVDEFEDEIE